MEESSLSTFILHFNPLILILSFIFLFVVIFVFPIRCLGYPRYDNDIDKCFMNIFINVKEDAHRFKNLEKPMYCILAHSFSLDLLFVSKNSFRKRRENS